MEFYQSTPVNSKQHRAIGSNVVETSGNKKNYRDKRHNLEVVFFIRHTNFLLTVNC